MMPGLVVHGTAVVAWLEGRRFLSLHARTDHPDFPDSLSVIGRMDLDRVGEPGDADPAAHRPSTLRMHYFDSRGVFRDYETSVDAASWRWWRESPGFSQRFTGLWSEDGRTITGLSQLRRDAADWADDLAITYRRQAE